MKSNRPLLLLREDRWYATFRLFYVLIELGIYDYSGSHQEFIGQSIGDYVKRIK